MAVGYNELPDVFFAVHDPAQFDRQGPDVGTQYRPIVLFHDDEQKQQVSAYIDTFDEEYDDKVVTESVPLETSYGAEEHRQDYFEKVNTADGNTNDAYYRFNAAPKMEKVWEKFADEVKAEAGPDA